MSRLLFWLFLLGGAFLAVEWIPSFQTSIKWMVAVGDSDWYARQLYVLVFLALIFVVMELYVWARSLFLGFFLMPSRWLFRHGQREKMKEKNQQDQGFHSLVRQDWKQALSVYESFSKKRINDEVRLGAYYAALNLGDYELAKKWLSGIDFPDSMSWNKELLSLDLMWRSGHQDAAFLQMLDLFAKEKESVIAQKVFLYGVERQQWKLLDEHIETLIRSFRIAVTEQKNLQQAMAEFLQSILNQPKRFYAVYRLLPKVSKECPSIDAIYALYLKKEKDPEALLTYIERKIEALGVLPEYVEAYSREIVDPARQLEKAIEWQVSNEVMVDVLIARCNAKQGVVAAAGDYFMQAWEKSGSWSYISELYDFLMQSGQSDLIAQYAKKINLKQAS